MAKLDRLGWAAGTAFGAYGVRIGVRVSRPEILDLLRERLPPGWRPRSSAVVDQLYSLRVGESRGRVRGYHLLYSGVVQRARTERLDEALGALEADLRLGVAAAARRRVFVHAGVVGWRGRAILVPGATFSGKTTLVAELVRAGARYYSDEFAVLDAQGRVHPFTKPLSIRERADRTTNRSAEALGGRAGRRPLPLGLVVFSPFRPGARWRPTRLTTGQALLGLLAHTVPARRRPEESLTALERSLRGAIALKGARGEAEAVAPSLLRWLETRGTAEEEGRAVQPRVQGRGL